jgi:hypothetical protein
MQAEQAAFRAATVETLFESAKGERFRTVKLSPEAAGAKAELLRLFVDEALTRAAQLAHQEGFAEMHPEHVSAAAPVLVLPRCRRAARSRPWGTLTPEAAAVLSPPLFLSFFLSFSLSHSHTHTHTAGEDAAAAAPRLFVTPESPFSAPRHPWPASSAVWVRCPRRFRTPPHASFTCSVIMKTGRWSGGGKPPPQGHHRPRHAMAPAAPPTMPRCCSAARFGRCSGHRRDVKAYLPFTSMPTDLTRRSPTVTPENCCRA